MIRCLFRPTWIVGLLLIGPVGHGAENPSSSFKEFYAKFQKAIKDHDRLFIEAILDGKVQFNFGPNGSGKKAFLTAYKNLDKQSQFWKEAERILQFPVHETHSSACVPSLVCDGSWPEAYDVGYVKTLNKDVKAYYSADKKGGHQTLPNATFLAYSEAGPGWVVVSLEGKEFYVEKKLLIAPSFRRLGFQRTAEGWRLSAFIQGD